VMDCTLEYGQSAMLSPVVTILKLVLTSSSLIESFDFTQNLTRKKKKKVMMMMMLMMMMMNLTSSARQQILVWSLDCSLKLAVATLSSSVQNQTICRFFIINLCFN